MLEAAGWGVVSSGALLIGAFLGLRFAIPSRVIGLIMGFGAGVLIASVAFDLTMTAYREAGDRSVAIGMALGALSFFIGDWLVDQRGRDRRERASGQAKAAEEDESAAALVIGALLDGVPESIVIGISLLGGSGVSLVMLVAVFISNIPEALASATGMKAAGRSHRYVYGLWGAVVLVSAVASALGYGVLGDASPDLIALIQAFAAGAILTMLANTMMPEAFEEGGNWVGLITVFGFALASYLSTIGG